MLTNTEAFYGRKLQRYFDDYWGEYDETAQWCGNSDSNKWLFDIRELGLHVELTCDEKGKVTEERYKL